MTDPTTPPGPMPPPPPPPDAYLSPASRTNPLAIVGLVLAFVMPVVGLVLGIVARRQIAQTGEGGAGLALAAVIVGAVAVSIQAIVLIAWIAGYLAFLPAGIMTPR